MTVVRGMTTMVLCCAVFLFFPHVSPSFSPFFSFLLTEPCAKRSTTMLTKTCTCNKRNKVVLLGLAQPLVVPPSSAPSEPQLPLPLLLSLPLVVLAHLVCEDCCGKKALFCVLAFFASVLSSFPFPLLLPLALFI